jgi:hypothetical protein
LFLRLDKRWVNVKLTHMIKARGMKIERGVKLPPARAARNEVYQWAKMRLGDSITVDIDLETRRRAQSAASTYKRRHPGWDYTTRLEPEDGVMRIWRLK